MAETITMPKLGFDMAEGTLVRWVKQEGETINKGEILAEIETDKATVEVESHAAGTILRLLVNQGDVVPVSSPIAVIGVAGEKVEVNQETGAGSSGAASDNDESTKAIPENVRSEEIAAIQPPPLAAQAPMKASPLARKMAQDAMLDLGTIRGSGPGGRIVRRDIEGAIASKPVLAQAPSTSIPAAHSPVSTEAGTFKMSKLRQAIARRMIEAKQSVPHFYVTHEYRMDALLDLRKQVNSLLPDEQTVTVNDFILKAAALTLRDFPNLTSSFAGENIIRHAVINMGVAVAVEGGLLTVVCRDTDHKPLRQIAAEVKAMATRARDGKVHPEDIEGSTFSVSNLGMYDVENFAAIINPPEAAILAVGSAREVPVVEDGQVKVGRRMKVTLSVDHRVSDGAEGARFMQALAQYLEEPLRLLI